jgi:dipeptidyl aminopeptidase/acylaminoacyl peptidase
MSPDGSTVVYARRTIEDGKYRKRLWAVPYEGGERHQLTYSDCVDSAPRFSPDGRELLFLSDRSGNSQPWVMPLSGGEPRRVAEIEGDVGAAEWSPNAKRIALLAPSGEQRFLVGKEKDPVARRITELTWKWDGRGIRDQFTALWVVRRDGGKPKRLVTDLEVSEMRWAPGGDEITFLADGRPEAAIMEEPQVWSVSRSGGARKLVAELAGSALAARWSRGGSLATVGIDRRHTPEWANASLFVFSDGQKQDLCEGLDLSLLVASYGDLIDPDAAVAVEWLDDSTILALASERGDAIPWRFGLDGGRSRIVKEEAVCTALATGSGRVAVVANVDAGPAEVYAVEEGGLRPLTERGSRWIAPWRRRPERLTIRHPEGHEVDGWLLTANGSRSQRPLVLQVHGGPHASHCAVPWLEMYALADAGFHVLYANPRGSVGYGEAYARALHGAWGDPDGSDLLAMVDRAIDEGLTSANSVGVLGLSYGGYMVNWLLGHFPDRFAAGVSENPVTDMVGEYGESDVGVMTGDTAVGAGRLPEDIEEFLRRSPYLQIHRTRAPLLLLHCDGDLRCPPGQSELVFAILRARGAPVEMVRYPEESHYLVGIGRPDRRVDRIERIVAWFEHHLPAPLSAPGEAG